MLFFPPSSWSSNTLVTEAPQVSSLQEHMGGARGAKESNPKQMGRRWRRTQYVCGCVRGKRRRQCVERLTPPPPLHTCQSRWRHWQLIPEPGGLAGGLLFNSVEGFCFFFFYFFIFEGVGFWMILFCHIFYFSWLFEDWDLLVPPVNVGIRFFIKTFYWEHLRTLLLWHLRLRELSHGRLPVQSYHRDQRP